MTHPLLILQVILIIGLLPIIIQLIIPIIGC